jgi:hypothetical protein
MPCTNVPHYYEQTMYCTHVSVGVPSCDQVLQQYAALPSRLWSCRQGCTHMSVRMRMQCTCVAHDARSHIQHGLEESSGNSPRRRSNSAQQPSSVSGHTGEVRWSPLYRRPLAIRCKVCAIHFVAWSRDHSCKVLDEEHPDVAASLDNLAGLLWNTGRSEEAYVYRNSSISAQSSDNAAIPQGLGVRTKRFIPSMRGVCCLLSRMCFDTQ